MMESIRYVHIHCVASARYPPAMGPIMGALVFFR